MTLLLMLDKEVNQLEVCELAGAGIDRLRTAAARARPRAMRLRMTNPDIHA
jgi:hypothetical protein